MTTYARQLMLLVLVASVAAATFSARWRVAYIFTILGIAAIVLTGHLVTIDDDLPGGWSNPDGSQPFPWRELVIKAAVVLVLGLLTLSSSIRALGR